MVKRVFWNIDEQRPRALWRILLQIILLIAMAIPLFTAAAVPGFIVLFLQSQDLAAFFSGTFDTSLLVNQIFNLTGALAILAAMLLSVWLAGRFADKRPFAEFGFHMNRDWWIDFGFGLLLGAGLMVMIFTLELAAGYVEVTATFYNPSPDSPFWFGIFSALIIFTCVGIYEELFSRGYQLRNIAEGLNFLNSRWAILISTILTSAFFGILHANNPNATAVSTFNIFLAGIFLAVGLLLTGELALPIALHITWNFFQGQVFGFPVSGQGGGPSFIAVQQLGEDPLTGGAFGPEAGLIGLAAIVLGTLLIAGWVKWRYGRVRLFTELTIPTHTVEKA